MFVKSVVGKKVAHHHFVDPTAEIQVELERCLSSANHLSERLVCSEGKKQEKQWLESELKKALRAIYWTVDDYQHTLALVNLDSTSAVLSPEDKLIRSSFIESAREYADELRVNVLGIPLPPKESTSVKVHKSVTAMASGSGSYKYSLLSDQDEETGNSSGAANGGRFEDILLKQDQIVRQQDDDLELVGRSVSTLKNMSFKIGDELDHQAIMLDDLGNDMERVDSKLDGVMKKIAKLSHLDDDNRQCKAIMVLSALLFFLVFILIVL